MSSTKQGWPRLRPAPASKVSTTGPNAPLPFPPPDRSTHALGVWVYIHYTDTHIVDTAYMFYLGTQIHAIMIAHGLSVSQLRKKQPTSNYTRPTYTRPLPHPASKRNPTSLSPSKRSSNRTSARSAPRSASGPRDGRDPLLSIYLSTICLYVCLCISVLFSKRNRIYERINH
ncbi:hypothetical protein F4774DRAFT_170220 [Daldinia eschscholtzii]|nr:hypothetical protein F4774DRAFT_170220 [Daldinia eschscholtzii]